MSSIVEFPKKEKKRIDGNVLNTPYGDIYPLWTFQKSLKEETTR